MYNLNDKYGKSCLSISEVATEIGVSEDMIKAVIDDGQLTSLKIGNEVVVTIVELEKFLGIGQQSLDISSDLSYYTTNSDDDWEINIIEGDDDMSKGYVTYVKASDRWIVQLDMGKTAEGKRIRKSKSFKTEDEARNFLAMELAKIYPTGIPSEVKVPTYEEVAIEFLNAKNSTATGRSWDSYRDFSKYSINYLGKKRIDKIEKADVIKMFNSLKAQYVYADRITASART